MAKENYISLRGQLRSEVKFVKDEDGTIILAMFPLMTMRRSIYDRAGNLSPKWDRPIIATSDPEMIRQLQKLKLHDIVEVKGTFHTRYSKKRTTCPHCNHSKIIDCPIQTINPVFVDVLNDKITNDTDGTKYLLNCAEVSNIAKVLGRVCTKTDEIYFGETDHGELYARYQLAVNRKLYIKDSEDEEDHTDYPIVYSYGQVASDDMAVLQQNALVYLDGYVHTMVFDQEIVCDECGEHYPDKRQRMNLTPYSMEYLRDYNDVIESTHKDNHDVNEEEMIEDVDK